MLSEEQFHAIDKLLAKPGPAANARFTGKPTLCDVPHPDVDLLNEELRSAGFISYAALPNFRPRRKYERSLWVRTEDNRCVPELHALASLRYGVLTRDPFWMDGDWTNTALSNVAVPEASPQRSSKYGVRSTTSEYRKKYYADPVNKARQRESARIHAKKKREAERLAKGVIAPDVVEELRSKILGNEDGRVGDDDDRAFGSTPPAHTVEVLRKDENS